MARVVVDALSHQGVRELGTESEAYGVVAAEAGRWRGQRLGGLRAALAAAGHELEVLRPDPDTLDDAAVLVVGSRSQLLPFDAIEVDAISTYLATGGGLLLMANHRGMIAPQQQLAEALGLPVRFNDISVVNGPRIEMTAHKLAAGISALVIRNGCSLGVSEDELAVARFTEPRHVFAAAMPAGLGRVVAVADSGFMASRDDAGRDMFAAGGNARFLGNVLGWLAARS